MEDLLVMIKKKSEEFTLRVILKGAQTLDSRKTPCREIPRGTYVQYCGGRLVLWRMFGTARGPCSKGEGYHQYQGGKTISILGDFHCGGKRQPFWVLFIISIVLVVSFYCIKHSPQY